MVAVETASAGESVLNDIEAGETPLSVKQAAKHPLLGPCDLATVYRLLERGRNGVRLEFAQTPKGRIITPSAITRFVARLTAVARGESSPVGRSPRRRQRDLQQAAARLERAGI